jgi:L-lactate dehydrogenase complex protein LldG
MSARETILKAITANKPALVSLPVMNIADVIQYDDITAQFKKTLEGIGGKVVELVDWEQLKNEIDEEQKNGSYIINTLPELGLVEEGISKLTALQLESVEKAYIRGTLGVAENGSVWLYETQLINRLLPFICQHLILVMEKKNIVATMHQAYQQIDSGREGFGVFIAGPSKTADIEQSLVIGAHGARSLVVYLV